MNKALLILVLILLGCKQQGGFSYDEPTYVNYPSPFAIAEIDKVNNPDIDSFVEEFKSLAESFNYPLENYIIYTKITDLKSASTHILGQCHIYGNDRLVLVDQAFWQTASEDHKRSLVFHELGHCYLNRSHRTLYYQGTTAHYDQGLIPFWDYATHANWPLSLMHRSLVSDDKFRHEFEFYSRELFDERGFSDQKVTHNRFSGT